MEHSLWLCVMTIHSNKAVSAGSTKKKSETEDDTILTKATTVTCLVCWYDASGGKTKYLQWPSALEMSGSQLDNKRCTLQRLLVAGGLA